MARAALFPERVVPIGPVGPLSGFSSGSLFRRCNYPGWLKAIAMAGRRVALKAIDWAAFAERVSVDQKPMFNAFKSRSDAIAAKLASLPETAPAIDWTFYRTAVANPTLVDEFEKKFKALQIPLPADIETAKISTQEKESDKNAADFIQASKARIVEYEEELQQLRNMIPFENMTYEDLPEKFRDPTLDPVKYPHWPHKLASDV